MFLVKPSHRIRRTKFICATSHSTSQTQWKLLSFINVFSSLSSADWSVVFCKIFIALLQLVKVIRKLIKKHFYRVGVAYFSNKLVINFLFNFKKDMYLISAKSGCKTYLNSDIYATMTKKLV